jgi:hypothetical protein
MRRVSAVSPGDAAMRGALTVQRTVLELTNTLSKEQSIGDSVNSEV